MKTVTLLPPRALLDFLCIHVERQVRRRIMVNPNHPPASVRVAVKSLARETITTLLSKPSFLDVLRESLPAHELVLRSEPSDVEFWRLTAQLEALLNDRSNIDIDDALALAFLADVVVESTMAALRGG